MEQAQGEVLEPPDTDAVWDAFYYGVFEGFGSYLEFLSHAIPFIVVLLAGLTLLGVGLRFLFSFGRFGRR